MKTRILLTVLVVWLIVPTGTPDDIITFGIIKLLGLEIYLLILLVILILLWQYNISFKEINGLVNQSGKEVRKRFRWRK